MLIDVLFLLFQNPNKHILLESVRHGNQDYDGLYLEEQRSSHDQCKCQSVSLALPAENVFDFLTSPSYRSYPRNEFNEELIHVHFLYPLLRCLLGPTELAQELLVHGHGSSFHEKLDSLPIGFRAPGFSVIHR